MDRKEIITTFDEETLDSKPANMPLSQDEDLDEIDVEMLLPSMNVSKQFIPPIEEKECIVKDDTLMDLYGEILTNCRDDRTKVDEILELF